MSDASLRRVTLCGIVALLLATAVASGATPVRAAAPGPGTWFVGQWYGNTVWSHDNPYPAGQGMHFGIDFNTPCGTTVLAIGDGVVFAVDGPYGAAPHNLVIEHPN